MIEAAFLLARADIVRAPGVRAAHKRTSVGAPAYQALAILTLVYVFNVMDRSIVTILLQPMGEELGLHDWQLGLLNGLAFAALSTVLGLKIARLADRSSRVRLIACSLLCWSTMTLLCGRAANFSQLLLCRMGVGVGEAGATPASHSIIADYFPPHRRATAHAIFGVGLPIGGTLGMAIGGVIVDLWGWRAAFLTAGIPGLALSLLLLTTRLLAEPPRGRYDTGGAMQGEIPPFRAVLALLWRHASARHTLLGLTLSVLVGNVAASFSAAFLVRQFGFNYSFVALVMVLTTFVPAGIGVLTSGLLADRLARYDRRWYMWMPAVALLLSAPFQLFAYSRVGWIPMTVLLVIPGLCAAAYVAPSYATLQNLAEPRMRATVTAIATMCTSLIGMGLGPLLGGISIDLLTGHYLAAAGFPGLVGQCHGSPVGNLALACHAAIASGTRATLMLWAPLTVWPAIHYFIAARTIRADLTN